MINFYQSDHEGSVTHLTDGSGNVIERYKYDAFGAPTMFDSTSQPINASTYGNRFLFTGREYTQKFGVYEYRNRAYHPGLGRFTSEDPMGFAAGDNNLYRYCHNDPVNKSDPTGLIFTDDVETQEVDRLNGGLGLGQTFPALDVKAIDQKDGTYRLRLDVRIVKRLVATQALSKGKIKQRTDEQIKASHTHEEEYHHDDWKGFHDAKQSEIPDTQFRTKAAAEAAAKPLEERLNKDLKKANEQFNQHKPSSRWDALRRKEGI